MHPFLYFHLWTLDSGTTYHICLSFSCFTSYHKINPVCIKLPNGNQVTANYSGSIFLNKNDRNNDQYIPCFSFNLLSVAKLINNLSCVLTFDFTNLFEDD